MNKLGRFVMVICAFIIVGAYGFAGFSVYEYFESNGIWSFDDLKNNQNRNNEIQNSIEIPITGSSSAEIKADPVLSKLSEDEKMKQIKEETQSKEGFCLTNYVQKYALSHENIAKLYREACVTIHATPEFGNPSQGSGVAIAGVGYTVNLGTENQIKIEQGTYIITNQHVTHPNNQDGYDIDVFVFDSSYDSVIDENNPFRPNASDAIEGKLLWTDFNLDMSIIYVEENIDWVKIKDRSIKGDEKLGQNEEVYAIGSPVWDSGKYPQHNIISKGTICGTSLESTFVRIGHGVYEDNLSNVYEYLIPMKVPIYGGNSGGGLFDDKGYLVGQPTLGTENSYNAETINYSIPIYPATLILEDLVEIHEKIKPVKPAENSTQLANSQYSEKIFQYENNIKSMLKFYSISNIGLVTMDSVEAGNIYLTNTSKGCLYYGEFYESLEHNGKNTGVQVIASTESKIAKNDHITHIEIDEKVELNCRNDLIFEILKARKGDVIKFYIEGKDAVEIIAS